MSADIVLTNAQVIPTRDRLLIRPLKSRDTSEGGVILPESAQEKSLEGIVVATGPGLETDEPGIRIPMSVRAGDHVLCSKFTLIDVSIDGTDYYIISERDVLAVLTKTPE